ncbi:MAG: hypothetical protein U0744_07665 [Gemmataceae bacterium]
MSRIRLIACGLVMLGGTSAFGQFLPPPVVAVPIGPPSGIGFRYQSGPLTVRGFVGNGPRGVLVTPIAPGYYPGPIFPVRGYPWGIVENRVNIHVIQPTVIVEPRRLRLPEEFDLSGVDLDVSPPPRAPGDVPWKPEPAVVKKPKAEPPPQVAKAPEPKPVVVVPKEKPKAEPAKPPAKAEPIDEGKRLVTLGEEAARRGEYGLAAKRFGQAIDLAPLDAQPRIWLAHVQVVLGKFGDAEASLMEGLKQQRGWPKEDARPLKHLYDADLNLYQQHRRHVEDAVQREPNRAARRFLLAYLLWYEGRRDIAAEQFRLAKPGLADPTLAELFLDL